ncbi:MAG: carbohydrate ABC transporter permease [Armatimonadetes bacterium]|nr:carbohydrate ABC transporter permease [Armatimonadota bacterium]
MAAAIWMFAVLLVYVGIGTSIVVAVAGFRARRPLTGTIEAILPVFLYFVIKIIPLDTTSAILSYGSILTVVGVGLYWIVLRPLFTWKDRKRTRESVQQAAFHLVLLTGSIMFLVPFAWMVVTSLKEDSQMSKFPPEWNPTQQLIIKINGHDAGLAWTNYNGQRVKVAEIHQFDNGNFLIQIISPASLKGKQIIEAASALKDIRHFDPLWKNYPDALRFLPSETDDGLVFLWNTVYLSLLSIIGTIISCSMVAYSFARLRWPGRDVLFVVLLATMMLPGAVTMMPVFLIFRWMGWIDSLKPLWVPTFFGSAFSIFLLRQFFMTIPMDLEDAAKIDGCSYFGIYSRIMLPLIKPALAAITIMTFMGAWNNFMGPLIYVNSPMRMPLAYALQLFQTEHGGEPGMLMAASVMVTLPVILLFFFTQRYFIEGVTLTGIKG